MLNVIRNVLTVVGATAKKSVSAQRGTWVSIVTLPFVIQLVWITALVLLRVFVAVPQDIKEGIAKEVLINSFYLFSTADKDKLNDRSCKKYTGPQREQNVREANQKFKKVKIDFLLALLNNDCCFGEGANKLLGGGDARPPVPSHPTANSSTALKV